MIDYTHVSFQTFKNPIIKMMNPFSSNNEIKTLFSEFLSKIFSRNLQDFTTYGYHLRCQHNN